MKVYKKMILTYIDKYNSLNFDILSFELGLPVSTLVGLVDELFLAKYIKSVNQKILVTDRGKVETYSSWNEITVNKKCVKSQSFKWDELYIPENFLQKL